MLRRRACPAVTISNVTQPNSCFRMDIIIKGSRQHSWSLDQIALTVMTVKRSEDYLSKTLSSLVSADSSFHLLKKMNVAVDDVDGSWVDHSISPKTINIVPLTQEESDRANTYKLHRRACHNYYRALMLSGDCRGLIVCEDDIIYRNGWLVKLCQALNEMETNGLTEFVISLYSASNHDAPWLRRGEYYSSYVASNFFGTQCVFYTASELQEITSLIWKCGVEQHQEPYDLLVKRHCERKQNLYTTRVALAQHVGQQSTGLGWWHCSPTFDSPWPDSSGG